MNLTNYQIINTAKNANKYVHTKGSKTSKGAKLVINTDNDSEDYDFLLFPVDPLLTGDTDFFYMVHTESGYVLGAEDESTKENKNVVLAKITGELDQHWSFKVVDANENYSIVNRNSGLVWRLKGGDTSNSTVIKQVKSEDGNSYYFNFQLQVDQESPTDFKEIPNPELVGYEKRYIENTINDTSLVPPADKTARTYTDTTPVTIGECSAPYYMIDDDNKRSLSIQVKETPYYIIKRSQYWKFLGSTDIPAGKTHEERFEYTYGASLEENEEFTSISDWTLASELSIAYQGISAGVSATIGESMEIKKGSSSTKYEETTSEIKEKYDAVDYERIVYYWQIVDVIEILNGDRTEVIATVNLPGVATYTTLYSDNENSSNLKPKKRRAKRIKSKVKQKLS